MEQNAIIEIQNLSKVFGTGDTAVTALSDINLSVEKGEIFGIIGLSGAGKSTLVRCVNLLERPTAGSVIVDGADMTRLSEAELRRARRSIGMIFQGFNLLMQRTAEENICFPLLLAGTPRREAKARARELLEIVGLADETKKSVVTGIEMFRKLLDFAEAGDNVGTLLRGIDKKEIERGQVLAKPGSIKPHTKFRGQVYVLTKDEGGRHTPFFNNYRPQFYFRTTDVTGVVALDEGVEMCMPGDNIEMNVELITPIAIEEGLRFAIREGGRTVGSGVVIAINE